MSQRDPSVALRHMRDHAREALEMSTGVSREDLDTDRKLNLALVRLLEIIGEAANRVPDDVQALHPDVPWQQLIGLRNRLIHGYDDVDHDILWAILTGDLPKLISALDKIG